MSDDNITLTFFCIIAKVAGQPHYFKWDGKGNLCTAHGMKGAAYFKKREADRIINTLKKNNYPYELKLVAMK